MKNNAKLITGMAGILLVLFMAIPGFSSDKLEEGTVTGKIERVDGKFLRDYEKMDYKGQTDWEQWGKGLNALGWIVVQGDSGRPKDYLLLVIDTRSILKDQAGSTKKITDLAPGNRISAEYKMGWDGLHALKLEKLN